MRCPSCGSTEMLTVTLNVDQSPTVVRICTECETRTWERNGEEVPAPEVMQGLRRQRKEK